LKVSRVGRLLSGEVGGEGWVAEVMGELHELGSALGRDRLRVREFVAEAATVPDVAVQLGERLLAEPGATCEFFELPSLGPRDGMVGHGLVESLDVGLQGRRIDWVQCRRCGEPAGDGAEVSIRATRELRGARGDTTWGSRRSPGNRRLWS